MKKIPTDVTKEGWIFDPQEGQRSQGKYIFGEETSVNKEKLKFSLGDGKVIPSEESEFDESNCCSYYNFHSCNSCCIILS